MKSKVRKDIDKGIEDVQKSVRIGVKDPGGHFITFAQAVAPPKH